METSGSDPNTITVVVKTPNQSVGDQTVEGVDVSWTVRDLKSHLSRVYPNNPAENDQRLIYSGKLLPDHLHISDIFRKTDSTPTIHLVCAFRGQSGDQQGAVPKVRAQEQHRATPAPPEPSGDGLRHRREAAPPGASTASPGSETPGVGDMNPPSFPTYSLYSPHQLLWLQQAYAHQYYMQYQAALAAAATVPGGPSLPVPPPHQAPGPPALPNQPPMANLPPVNRDVPDPAFVNAAGANQNLRMNAQGGPVMEDEEDVNRDWLDWVYTGARLGVFLSIVYFYSSVSRFVLVMSSLLFMYLHTAGWFPFRRRPAVRDPIQPAPEVIQNQQNQNRNLGNAEAPAGGDIAEAEGVPEDNPHPLTPVLVPVHRVSLTWTAWVFFKAFFASLIPEGPQGLAN